MSLFTGQEWRQTWQPLVHSWEGEGGASGERGDSTYAQHVRTYAQHVRTYARTHSTYARTHSTYAQRVWGGELVGRCSDDPEGRDGGGGEAHEGRGTCVVEADSSCCVAETNATL